MAGTDIAEYGVKFINTETLEEVQAKVKMECIKFP